MNLGVHVTGHVASRAIVTEARRGGHVVQGINLSKLSETKSDTFGAIVIANVVDPVRIAALLGWISSDCHLIFISTHLVLPSGFVAIPWSEEDFDPTSESLAEAGVAQAARLAERLLMLAAPSVRWTILRPAIVEGPHDPDPLHTRWFVERILSPGPICLPEEDEQPYRHISTRDLGRAVLTVLGTPRGFRKVLHICSDGILTPTHQARAVSESLGYPLEIEYVSQSLWDRAELQRPMAGRNGSALLAPSPTLVELGWAPTPPMQFIKNLSQELKEQPRRLNPRGRSAELSLASTKKSIPVSEDNKGVRWVLRSDGGSGHGIVAVRGKGNSRPWKTIAVALGQDVQCNATRLNALGIDRPLTAPMLAEVSRAGRKWRKLVCGELARDSLDEDPAALDIPQGMGDIALLAFPLAVLLASWPEELPDGEVWVLGRGAEAWLATLLAGMYGRVVRLLGPAYESPPAHGFPAIEAFHARRTTAPAMLLNISGGSMGDDHLISNLQRDGILVSPDLYRPPLNPRRSMKCLVSLPDRTKLLQALDLLVAWKVQQRHPNCLFQLSLDGLGSTFIAPALRLPVLSLRSLP